ncbi:MAG: 16S rRNA (cytidine(1402)-2'-O)-methyltransferase [Rickettsiaceae bacterium]|nr:16S rRNA (cytidine(1402)-2'-O)-methyltransferase [Rickettsiaceae bacterium]
MKLKTGLYIVSTPIGNLDDITLRALYVLKNSNIILCEDSRVTQKLLLKHNIFDKKLIVYNDHSGEETRNKVIDMIQDGMVISLVSDAGTPMISDPGYKLARSVGDAGLLVDVMPGPCAAIAALSLSLLPVDKFYFAGFAPRTRLAKDKFFSQNKLLDASIILYDTGNRIFSTLESCYEILGDRQVAIAREITKIHQEVIRGHLSRVIPDFGKVVLKGEFVLIVEKSISDENGLSEESIAELVKYYLDKNISSRDISSILKTHHDKKISRNQVYNIVSQIRSRSII